VRVQPQLGSARDDERGWQRVTGTKARVAPPVATRILDLLREERGALWLTRQLRGGLPGREGHPYLDLRSLAMASVPLRWQGDP